MDAQEVKLILIEILGEDKALSLIPAAKCVFENPESLISVKNYNTIVEGMESCFVDSMENDGDSEKSRILEKGISKIRNLREVVEEKGKKQMMVCKSDIFTKYEKIESKWNPLSLVSLPVSWTKSFDIAPDIREDDPTNCQLSLVHKYPRSKSAPLVIPIDVREMEQFLLGSMVMFSIFDSSRKKFPVVLKDPETCNEMLKSTKNWAEMGELILSSFDLTPERIGDVLKSLLESIVLAEPVMQTGSAKMPKRKKPTENLVDVWAERKKSYITNMTKKSKNV